MLIFVFVLSAIVLIIAAAATIQPSELWVRAFCWAFFVFSLIGIAELFTSYVTLGEQDFRMRKNFRTTIVPRENIASVAVAKGCPTTLLLNDGGKVVVPELGGKGIGNSLRAWIKATQ